MTVMVLCSAIRLPQGNGLGKDRRFWAVMLGREVAGATDFIASVLPIGDDQEASTSRT